MQTIHLEVGGKSARLQLQALPEARPSPLVVQRTTAGPVQSVRVVSGVAPRTAATALSLACLVEADPELDLAAAGRVYEREQLSTAFYDPSASDPRPIGDFAEIDILHDASGAEKERRPHTTRRSNLNELLPVKAGKRLPLAEALTQFVFRQTLQIVHTDSLSYEFLHGLARDLHTRGEIALLGAGAKGNSPLVVREKGNPYRAFLFGEVGSGAEADRYRLLLLLSDMELKAPAAPATA